MIRAGNDIQGDIKIRDYSGRKNEKVPQQKYRRKCETKSM